MKQEYKDALQWALGGKEVQVNINTWTTCSIEGVMRHILNGADVAFRLKPRTMKIGKREIAAPLPVSTETTAEGFTTDNYGNPHHWWGTTQFGQDLLKAGRVFATADDAVDAYNAVSELLRGEE